MPLSIKKTLFDLLFFGAILITTFFILGILFDNAQKQYDHEIESEPAGWLARRVHDLVIFMFTSYLISVFIFFLIRGLFNLWWTIIQASVCATLMCGILLLFRIISPTQLPFFYLLYCLFCIPILKQLFDVMLLSYNVKKRSDRKEIQE